MNQSDHFGNYLLKKISIAALRRYLTIITAIGVAVVSQQPVHAAELKIIPDYPVSMHLDYFPTPELKALSSDIDQLYNQAKAKKDAYALSMPLLASAQIGDINTYQAILSSMQEALRQIPENYAKSSYKAWLTSRVAFAAYSIGDRHTAEIMIQRTHKLLKQYAMAPDAFSTWALGYLATGNKQQYTVLRHRLFSASETLSQTYEHALHDPEQSILEKQALRSNAIWAWICTLQAAAYARDVTGYQSSLKQIKKITAQSTIAEGLLKSLSHTKSLNDYPAWAISIVRLSAVLAHDRQTADTLINPLQNALTEARSLNATSEIVLAETNNALAELNTSSSLRAH